MSVPNDANEAGAPPTCLGGDAMRTPAADKAIPGADQALKSPGGNRGLSVPQACLTLGIGKTLFYRLASENKISIRKFGNRSVVSSEDVDRLLKGETR